MLIMQKTILGTVGYTGKFVVPEEFCWSMIQAVQYTNEYMCKTNECVHWDRGARSGQDMARNNLCQRMMGDWLLMLDSDHIFEPDLIYRMWNVFESFKLDILTGLYFYKDTPRLPVLYKWIGDKYEHVAVTKKDVRVDTDHPIKLIRVDSAGAGCLMVRSSVFDKIEAETGEKPFDRIPPYGEDFTFFERARKLGIEAWCCPNIESYHLRLVPTTIDDEECYLSKCVNVSMTGEATHGI